MTQFCCIYRKAFYRVTLEKNTEVPGITLLAETIELIYKDCLTTSASNYVFCNSVKTNSVTGALARCTARPGHPAGQAVKLHSCLVHTLFRDWWIRSASQEPHLFTVTASALHCNGATRTTHEASGAPLSLDTTHARGLNDCRQSRRKVYLSRNLS